MLCPGPVKTESLVTLDCDLSNNKAPDYRNTVAEEGHVAILI
jgi:hypothetical protein